jgi:hypothetical protein
MAVQYVRVNPVVDMFSPAIRGTGNIAIVGPADPLDDDDPGDNTAVQITTPDDANATFPGQLGESIALALLQTPGPSQVWGVRTAAADPNPWGAALAVVSGMDVQFVVLAGVVLDATSGNAASDPPGAIAQLSDHVTGVSNTGGDGMERMGVAMLERGSTDASVAIDNERMVYIAHKSDQDAAAAVAGTIAGYPPHISLLLKPVNIDADPFTPTEIQAINGKAEEFTTGPTGQGVNWLADPALLPGRGIYLGEGYTGNPGGKKYIDVVRTVDDVSFRLKARLIKTIGAVRISRSGLRSLVAQMEAILVPLVRAEVIDSYSVSIPILALLDKDPDTLTAVEGAEIQAAQNDRLVEVLIAVDYAGAIHRLSITLRFD